MLKKALALANKLGGKLVWMDSSDRQVRVISAEQLELHARLHPLSEFRLVLPLTPELLGKEEPDPVLEIPLARAHEADGIPKGKPVQFVL